MTKYCIDNFRASYFFLSNYYPCKIIIEGIEYQSAEAAFQAQKTLDENERMKFSILSPSEAKRLGRKIKLRSDWEDVKDYWMGEVVFCKFFQNPLLLRRLICTGVSELIEGNSWGDTYWGVCNGIGENKLGKILMSVREVIDTPCHRAMLDIE